MALLTAFISSSLGTVACASNRPSAFKTFACFSHTYILLLQKTAFFRLAPFYQPQRSVPPERSRKHNFKSKICFSLLDHISFFSSTPQNSEQAPHFLSETPHSLLPTPQSKRKNTPSQSSCDSNLVSINFCVATQKSAANEFFAPLSADFLLIIGFCSPLLKNPLTAEKRLVP